MKPLISHIYWIGEDYLGAIQLESFPQVSRHFLCYLCGKIYGKMVVIDADHIKQHWGCWTALCKECGTGMNLAPNTHCIPGGIPFFDPVLWQYPEPVMRYQLDRELEFFDARHDTSLHDPREVVAGVWS